MTENEALKTLEDLQRLLTNYRHISAELTEANGMAIQALEEIQAYRAIGTVEELQAIKSSTQLVTDILAEYSSIGTIEAFKALKERNSNKWIPCSERLPQNISTVLVQVKEIENPTLGWYGNMDGWKLTEKDFAELEDFTVIAWQPLPAPYQPKGE